MMICQDRSLGSVEFAVSALAKKSRDDGQYRYESTGLKEATDPIHLEKGNVYKGFLHYTATFLPALSVKGAKFEPKSKIADEVNDKSSTHSLSDKEGHDLLSGVTIKLSSKDAPKDAPKSHVATNSVDSVQSSESSGIAHTAEPSAPQEGVEMSPDELLAHRMSGVS